MFTFTAVFLFLLTWCCLIGFFGVGMTCFRLKRWELFGPTGAWPGMFILASVFLVIGVGCAVSLRFVVVDSHHPQPSR